MLAEINSPSTSEKPLSNAQKKRLKQQEKKREEDALLAQLEETTPIVEKKPLSKAQVLCF